MYQIMLEEAIKIQKGLDEYIAANFFDKMIPNELITDIKRIFSYYCPLKERSYLLKIIANSYDLSLSQIFPLMLGIESVFAAYYLKDDIFDKGISRLGNKTLVEIKGINYSIIVADILLEMGHELINHYFFEVKEEKYSSSPFISLIVGQFLTDKPNRFEDLSEYNEWEIASLKAGVLFKYMVFWLSPIMKNKIDLEVLANISYEIGILLQIKNDIEDFIIDPTLTNQPVLSDLLGGKFNYILNKFVKRYSLNDDEIDLIRKYWDNKEISNYQTLQDEVYNILEKENIISDSISDIYNKMELIERDIISLTNDSIKDKLIQYQKMLLTLI